MNKYQTALNNIAKGGKFIEDHKEDIDTLQELVNYKDELFYYKTLLSQYQQHFRKACEMLEEKTYTSALEWERIIESDD